jgi:hypothetical protein
MSIPSSTLYKYASACKHLLKMHQGGEKIGFYRSPPGRSLHDPHGGTSPTPGKGKKLYVWGTGKGEKARRRVAPLARGVTSGALVNCQLRLCIFVLLASTVPRNLSPVGQAPRELGTAVSKPRHKWPVGRAGPPGPGGSVGQHGDHSAQRAPAGSFRERNVRQKLAAEQSAKSPSSTPPEGGSKQSSRCGQFRRSRVVSGGRSRTGCASLSKQVRAGDPLATCAVELRRLKKKQVKGVSPLHHIGPPFDF